MNVEQLIEALFAMPDLQAPALVEVDGELREVRSVRSAALEPRPEDAGRAHAVLRVATVEATP